MTRKEWIGAIVIGVAFFIGFPLAYYLFIVHFGAFPCESSAFGGFICSGP
jgi:hypothetical protein